MADPLSGIDEDTPPEPVVPLDPELEVRCVLKVPTILVTANLHVAIRNYGHRERVGAGYTGLRVYST